uniref:AAA-4 family protein n=1 Tax=Cyanothece sp. (strain PCC 7425 / ATCC 29141) TaxID=395961 RepID=B8HTF0_CYAP4
MNTDQTFIKGNIFSTKEGEVTEFKDLEKSKKPAFRITNDTEEYIVGFLNASVLGKIYFGIKDDGEIIGICLSRSEQDDIEKLIPNKLRNTDPRISPSYYKIEIKNLYDINEILIENLFIVIVSVIHRATKFPYRTSDRGVYLRKGTTNMHLSSEEICEELKIREQKRIRIEMEEVEIELTNKPNDLHLLKHKAKLATYLGDADLVAAIYEKILYLSSNKAQTQVELATIFKSIGAPERALESLSEALRTDGKDPELLQQKGNTLLSMNRAEEALDSYNAAESIIPDNYVLLTQKGIVLCRLGKYQEAISLFNKALSILPSYRAAKYEKVKAYKMMLSKSRKT